MDRNFARPGAGQDPRNPDAKIQRALGINSEQLAFVQRDDDEAIAREAQYEQQSKFDKTSEDRSRDWICQRLKASGEICGARNFVKNEKCFACNALAPRS